MNNHPKRMARNITNREFIVQVSERSVGSPPHATWTVISKDTSAPNVISVRRFDSFDTAFRFAQNTARDLNLL